MTIEVVLCDDVGTSKMPAMVEKMELDRTGDGTPTGVGTARPAKVAVTAMVGKSTWEAPTTGQQPEPKTPNAMIERPGQGQSS